jgi:alkylhydroperoxidase/carboxymuconolactone decarboxylase family protein YurZ
VEELPKPADKLPVALEHVRAQFPDVAQAYDALGQAVRAAGPLTEREVAIAKLAMAIGARHEGATHAHVRKALALGLEPAAIQQVAVLACPTMGFPHMMMALGWVRDVLSRLPSR